jgi:hypothetical protein
MVASFRIAHSAGDLYGFLLKHSPLYGPPRSLRDLAFNIFDVPRHGAAPRMAPALSPQTLFLCTGFRRGRSPAVST